MSWHSLPAPSPRPRTARHAGATSSIWNSSLTCPVRMLVGVWRLNAASPAPTPTTAGTCLNTYWRGWRSTCSNIFFKNSPPYDVTQDYVSTPLPRLEVEQVTGHQSVRGQGGVIAVLYKTH